MEFDQQIQTTFRNGNLHVNLGGHFTHEAAVELTNAISMSYSGTGNIFIHTANITSVTPDTRHIFARCLNGSGLPTHQVYLMGSKGLDFNPDNVRVIVQKKKKAGCCGRCRDCSCHKDN